MHAKSTPEGWVLDPKMLQACIERDPVVLTAEDVALMASRIVKDMQRL